MCLRFNVRTDLARYLLSHPLLFHTCIPNSVQELQLHNISLVRNEHLDEGFYKFPAPFTIHTQCHCHLKVNALISDSWLHIIKPQHPWSFPFHFRNSIVQGSLLLSILYKCPNHVWMLSSNLPSTTVVPNSALSMNVEYVKKICSEKYFCHLLILIREELSMSCEPIKLFTLIFCWYIRWKRSTSMQLGLKMLSFKLSTHKIPADLLRSVFKVLCMEYIQCLSYSLWGIAL